MPFVQNDMRVRDEFLKKDVAVQGLSAEWDEGERWVLKLWITQLLKNPTTSNSINQHPTPHTQSTRHLDAWSLKNENVHSSQHFPQPVILRGAEGEVAESILQQTTLPSE